MNLFETVQNIARIFILIILVGMIAIFLVNANSLSYDSFSLRVQIYEQKISKLAEQNMLTEQKLIEEFGEQSTVWIKIDVKNLDGALQETILYESKEVTFEQRNVFYGRSEYKRQTVERVIGGKILEIHIIGR